MTDGGAQNCRYARVPVGTVHPVTDGPIELSRREEHVRNGVVVVVALGTLGFRVVGNVTSNWWPAGAFFVAFALFIVGFTAYLARTRKRAFRSVAVLSLPEFLKRRMSKTRSG